MSEDRAVDLARGPHSTVAHPRRLTVAGQSFERVCVRRTGVAVYRGDQAYLRIGPGLAAELDLHKAMLSFGFPVAGILGEGVHEGIAYFIEESLGPQTLGDRFEEVLDARGGITDEGFAEFMDRPGRSSRCPRGPLPPTSSIT